MERTFDINTQTTPATEFEFRGNQAARATQFGATRIFRWRDLRGSVRRLPRYITRAISDAGMVALVVGGTTFSYSVVALRPATEADRDAFERARSDYLRAWGQRIDDEFAFAYPA